MGYAKGSQLVHGHALHNDTRGRATAIADGRNAILPRLQLMQQCDEDPASGAAQRVAEGNRAAAGVHVGGFEAEDLGVGFDDGGEGFVEFPDGDVAWGEFGLGEELLDAGCGRDGEVDGVWWVGC